MFDSCQLSVGFKHLKGKTLETGKAWRREHLEIALMTHSSSNDWKFHLEPFSVQVLPPVLIIGHLLDNLRIGTCDSQLDPGPEGWGRSHQAPLPETSHHTTPIRDICIFIDTSIIFSWHQKHTNSRFVDTKHHCLKHLIIQQPGCMQFTFASLADQHRCFHVFSTEQSKDALQQFWHQ